MLRKRTGQLLLAILLPMPALAQKKTPEPNFYSDAPTATKAPTPTRKPQRTPEASPAATPKATPVATPGPSPKPTSETKPKPTTTPKSVPASKATTSTNPGITPKPTATPKLTPAAKPKVRSTPVASKKASAAKAGSPPVEGSGKGASVSAAPAGKERIPLDPLGLAAAARSRWDFTTVMPTLQEELAYRVEAAGRRTERLAKALTGLAAAVERRRRNAETAASITYVLARARIGSPGFAGPDLTSAHLAAARATLRQDAGVADSAMAHYDPLREALNASAERERELAAARAKGQAPQDERKQEGWAITVAQASLAEQRTRRMLRERVPQLEALKAALAAEAFARELQQRETWNSLAPPPPPPDMEYNPYVDPDTPLPDLTPNARPRVPEDPRQQVPPPKGMELPAPRPGAEVLAAGDGTVVHVGDLRGYGSVVILQHGDNLFSVYGHLEQIAVAEQQRVAGGQSIARVGTLPRRTSPGIFFDVRRGAASVEPSLLIKGGEPHSLLLR